MFPSIRTLVLLGFLVPFLVACEDPVPQDYTPQVVVESSIYVGDPMSGFRVYWSQSLADTFKFDNATIRDAQVTVRSNGRTFPFEYVADSTGGFYRAQDTTYRVEAETDYTLEVVVADRIVTGSTRTPKAISWTAAPRDTLYYPGRANELRPTDSLRVAWTVPAPGTEYVLMSICLDTVGYGQYRVPATADTNRRIRDEEFDDDSPLGPTPTRYFLAQQPGIFSWGAFKFFGKHELRVYAGDQNFIRWFKQITFSRSMNPLLQSVEGGLGCFGSAAYVRGPIFLVKDKP